MLASTSRKGTRSDNVVIGRLFGSLKTKRTDTRWYLTLEQTRHDGIHQTELAGNMHSPIRHHSTHSILTTREMEMAAATEKAMSSGGRQNKMVWPRCA